MIPTQIEPKMSLVDLLKASGMTNQAAIVLPTIPFRGIESFRYVDRLIFFAREEETRKLVRYVALYRGVLFYGDSGAGKSSLINAGFIPETLEEGFAPERLRVQPRRGEEIIVERIPTSPDGKPPYLPSLFSDNEDASRVVLSTAAFKARLEKLKEMRSERRPLLIFDQFEEFVTLFEEAPRTEADIKQGRESQSAILGVLVELLRDQQLPIKLLFSFREDYLAKLNKLFVLYPDLTDQYLRMTAPRTDALFDIVYGPFEHFPQQYGAKFSEKLSHEIADTFLKRSEGGTVSLSEVQTACLRLWLSDDPAALFKQKGVQGLLEDYQAEAINKLPEKLRDPAVILLGYMVTASGTRNVISADDLLSLAQLKDDISKEQAQSALNALIGETRLVRREIRRDTAFYEIVSEFLVPWIGQQKAARLALAERSKKRALIALSIVCLLITAGVGIAGWYIYAKRTQAALATDKVQEAMKAQHLAEDQRVRAEDERVKAQLAKELAEEAARNSTSQAQTLSMKVSEVEKSNSELNAQLVNLNAQAAALQKERDGFKAQVAALNKNKIDAGQVYELDAKNRDLQKQLDEARAQLNSLQIQQRGNIKKSRSDYYGTKP